MKITRFARRAVAGWLPLGRRYCVICNNNVWRFLPYGKGKKGVPPLISQLGMIGSDVDNFSCPRCNAHDRERHIFLYMDAAGIFSAMHDKVVVHFAPENHLASRISNAKPRLHIKCDLYPTSPSIRRMDLLAMDIESNSVDYLIANHVLEHVSDDIKALSEIRRVLKVGGYAILQTPYAEALHNTWEDSGILDEAARLQAYGQADHVRLYARDIFERFAYTDLKICVLHHLDLLPSVDPWKYGVNDKEPFFLFQRIQ